MNTSEPVVRLERVSDRVAQITLMDREAKNTFSEALVRDLQRAFDRVAADPSLRAVVLTGYATYFALGGTKEGLLAIHDGRTSFDVTNFYTAPLECEIPVIAAMQGHGIGGGFVMGLFADFVVMSTESIYATNFMRYGFTPGMGATYIVPKKLGFSLGHEMLISARNYRGAELRERGVPFPVMPRKDVLPYAHELARDVADKPRLSLVTLKSHLVREVRASLESIIEREVEMHETTFHQPEVRQRIERLF